MKTNLLGCAFVFALFISSCQKNATASPDPSPVLTDSSFIAKGADISWLTQMEQAGNKFYNASGAPMDCMELMQRLGINSIRLRVWVNPADGWNVNADVVQRALRARHLRFR